MAKKNNDNSNNPAQQSAPQTGGDTQAAPETGTTVTRAHILTFWGVIAVILAAAFLLDRFMPGTPERVIERWLMLPFGIFLAVFLYKLK